MWTERGDLPRASVVVSGFATDGGVRVPYAGGAGAGGRLLTRGGRLGRTRLRLAGSFVRRLRLAASLSGGRRWLSPRTRPARPTHLDLWSLRRCVTGGGFARRRRDPRRRAPVNRRRRPRGASRRDGRRSGRAVGRRHLTRGRRADGGARTEGHGPQRHVDITRMEMHGRLGTPTFNPNGTVRLDANGFVESIRKLDPMTGTTTDGVTGQAAPVRADRRPLRLAGGVRAGRAYLRQRTNETGAFDAAPIPEIFGADPPKLTGYYPGPLDPSHYREVDFTGGTVFGGLHLDANETVARHTLRRAGSVRSERSVTDYDRRGSRASSSVTSARRRRTTATRCGTPTPALGRTSVQRGSGATSPSSSGPGACRSTIFGGRPGCGSPTRTTCTASRRGLHGVLRRRVHAQRVRRA